jgi:uncharacterized membrane protein YdbT with pleckstrin-like domain
MKFIKKRNFVAGEELLYTPQLHWFYNVKPLVQSLPFFLILVIFWATYSPGAYSPADFGFDMAFNSMIRYTFLLMFLIVLVIFLCRIFIFITTEYGLTNKRLVVKKGVFRLSVKEIPTDRVERIHCVQGIWGRIFCFGTLFISGVGGRMLVYKMVAKPYAFRKKLADVIEKNKTVTVVQGDLPKEEPKPKPVVQEPPYRYGTFVRIPPNSVE